MQNIYFLSDILSICCIKLKAYTFIQFPMMNGGSVFQPVDVIIRFVALASIAKVDDIYASAIPKTTRTK